MKTFFKFVVIVLAAPVALTLQASAGEIVDQSLEEILNMKVVTVSRQKESLKEAPVPVTVITSEMIRTLGARSLKDILLTYVPGMTPIEDLNEMFAAMRGIYGSAQQKMLVLLNGHRLNSRHFAAADFDNGIDIDPNLIKQIEVLRGPGSSLYGNVALTGVINIITKDGADVNGMKVTLSLANYLTDRNQSTTPFAAGRTLRAVYGKGIDEHTDLLLWGSLFEAPGEKRVLSASEDWSNISHGGTVYLGRQDEPYSYDMGMRYITGPWQLYVGRRRSNYVNPLTDKGALYDLMTIRPFEGDRAGLLQVFSDFELKYSNVPENKVGLEVINCYNTFDVFNLTPSGNATAQDIMRAEESYDNTIQVYIPFNKLGGEGTLLVGTQVEYMHLQDSNAINEVNGEWSTYPATQDSQASQIVTPGQETTYSGFAQLKDRLSPKWVCNLGLRYDYKFRQSDDTISALSPRVGMTFIPNDRFDVKLSYSQSFVDAPYWYRFNNTASYKGSSNMTPEYLRSVQLNPTINFLNGHMNNSLTLSYNNGYDLIYKAASSGQMYQNSGNMVTYVAEDELAYVGKLFKVRAAMTYIYLNSYDHWVYGNGIKIEYVPEFSGHAVFELNPFWKTNDNNWLTVVAHYYGDQWSPTPTDANYVSPSATIFNVGVLFKNVLNRKDWSFQLMVENIADLDYRQGGTITYPLVQQGRSYNALFTIAL